MRRYYSEVNRTLKLDILATMSASDETLAYTFNKSKDPRFRELANIMIDNSNDIKRLFREKLTGAERDLYLLKAEGGPV